jgi:hypothetical protein
VYLIEPCCPVALLSTRFFKHTEPVGWDVSVQESLPDIDRGISRLIKGFISKEITWKITSFGPAHRFGLIAYAIDV